MIQVHSIHKLYEIEALLRQAAQRHGAGIQQVSSVGQLLREKGHRTAHDAIIFALSQPDLYAALLDADIRFAAFLPCRIAACEQAGHITLQTVSPREFSRILDRPGLDELVLSLETSLCQIMEEAAQPGAAAGAATGSHFVHQSGLGATESQVNVQGTLGQRIDRHGSKIEDLAGTGKHDAPGG